MTSLKNDQTKIKNTTPNATIQATPNVNANDSNTFITVIFEFELS